MSNGQGSKSKDATAKLQALDPRTPALVQPFKRLVEEGFLQKLTVEFTPSGYTAMGTPDDRMIAVDKSGLAKGETYPLGRLLAIAEQGNLIPLKGKAKKTGAATQPVPEKSLVKADFDKTAQELFARAQAVAQKCTGTTLVGRVRSEGAFDGAVTISFENWWRTATPAQKAISLMVKKHREGVTADSLAKLRDMQCPFRGPAEFEVAEEADEEEPQAPPSRASPPRN
jgi:hypothetical protein